MTEVETVAPATRAQHAIWFTEQAGVSGTAYTMPVGIWFDGALDVPALQEACAAVVARHELLSTAVDGRDGEVRLIPATRKITVDSGQISDDRIRAEAERRFDLGDGPLARFALLTDGPGKDGPGKDGLGTDGLGKEGPGKGSPTRYLLMVTAHHLVFDGTSKDVLVRDLATAYNAAVAGRPIDLGPAPAGYAEHAATEGARIAELLPRAREYWAGEYPREHRSAVDGVVLPDLERIPDGVEPGRTVRFDLGPDLVRGVDRLTGELGLTRFEVLLAAFHALLHAYGNEAVPVAVDLSTRTGAVNDHIGLFVNELPVLVPRADGSFRDLAGRVRAQVRGLYPLRAVPLAHAVGGLRPAVALTPVSFSYRRRAPTPTFTGVDALVDWMMFNGTARNALHLQVVDAPNGVEVSLHHSPTAITAAAVERIAAHLRTVLARASLDPDRSPVEVMPAAELEDVLRRWNATARVRPAGETVVSRFIAQARLRPGAVAVVDRGQDRTYGDLDAASAAVAGQLRRRGIGRGRLVAVSLGRSWEAVVALFGVLRAGAAYVPVDPTYPSARRALILDDARPDLLITAAPDETAAAETTTADVTTVDTMTVVEAMTTVDAVTVADLARGSEAGGDGGPGPDDHAYVMYTSGSTGRPKGVEVPHRALTNLILGLTEVLDAGRPDDRWLNLTSLSFDISGLELHLPLTTGGRVVIAPHALDGAAVVRLIRSAGVTHVQATPSGWRVLREGGLGEAGPEAVVALAGGEALPVGLAADLRARTRRLFNVYGPTETTIWSTAVELPSEVDQVTLGRPIANTRAYVLDGRQRPVPVGVPGELYLGGDGVATGYRGQPDLTAERFPPDPFTGGARRMYRTGDRCRWRADGQLVYLGRTDNQVKVRGHRVELMEIESALAGHPDVGEAVVALRDDALVGYVVVRTGAGGPALVGALRAHLAATLPAVMVPGGFVVLDRLPLTPNGKVDRRALPEPARAEPPATAPAADPAPDPEPDPDDVVGTVREIWQDVLQIADIGLDEDLFDLGGHSLTITRISSRIRQRLGVDLPLDVFFDTPTIAEIAAVTAQLRATADGAR